MRHCLWSLSVVPHEAFDEGDQCGSGSLGAAVEDSGRESLGLLNGEASGGESTAETPDALRIAIARGLVLKGGVATRFAVGQADHGHSHHQQDIDQLHDSETTEKNALRFITITIDAGVLIQEFCQKKHN